MNYFDVMNESDRGVRNVMNSFEPFINDDTFFKENYQLFKNAMYDLTDYIREVGPEHGTDIDIPTVKVDIPFYLNELLNDDKKSEEYSYVLELINKAIEDKNNEDENISNYLCSDDYACDRYSDCEYLVRDSDCYNTRHTAEKCFEEGNNHGFKSIEDMVICAKQCVKDGCNLTFYNYDSGSYGIHAVNGTEDYGFEVYGYFLGNGEEEEEAALCGIDIEKISKALPDNNWFCDRFEYDSHGYVYAQNNNYFLFAISWEDLESKGTELGMRK